MKAFDMIRASRTAVLEITAELSLEELNYIPASMNNNILWNMGHVIATQQNLCYLKSGLPAIVSDSFINSYKFGSRPENFIDLQEYQMIREGLNSHVEKLEEDYKNESFLNFKGYESILYKGLMINAIDDAITFLTFHEGLHLGYIMALKHQLPKELKLF